MDVLPAPSRDGATEIVRTLLSLYSARTGMDMPVDAFVTELLKAAPRTEAIEHQSIEAISQTLRDLLSIRPLSMISKARGIHTDHENTFCTARIITDLRAVFDTDVKDEPVGFVIAHILNLGYHHSGEHTNIHVAMDKVDIDNLIRVLQRARVKSVTLADAVKTKAGFEILAD